MITLLSPDFVLQEVTQTDMNIASIAWGFTLGFGLLTTWTAIKQTKSIWSRHGKGVFKSPYVWMIWLEIIDCLIFSFICWMHLNAWIPPSFAFYFTILTLWALQVQFLLQIIINRVSILLVSRRKSFWLKTIVAVVITAINISVYNIWIPARLQISHRYEVINEIWDRMEKAIYLVIDAGLNWYFMRTVKKELLGLGLDKYKPLLTFNLYIIGFSLAMDVLIISMMSLSNTFVYMQFHPLAYIVKLNIEMSMADLIAKVSKPSAGAENGQDVSMRRGDKFVDRESMAGKPHRRSNIPSTETYRDHKRDRSSDNHKDFSTSASDTDSRSQDLELMEMAEGRGSVERDMVVHTKREVHVTVSRMSADGHDGRGDADSGKDDNDERPLRERLEVDAVDKHGKRSGAGFGSKTHIWGHQKQV